MKTTEEQVMDMTEEMGAQASLEFPEDIVVENYDGTEVNYTRSNDVIGKKQAVAGGAIGALVAGGIGFVGGAYYERKKRKKLMAIISGEIERLYDNGNPATGLIEGMKKDITKAIHDSVKGSKERTEWETLFTSLINMTAHSALMDETNVVIEQINQESTEGKNEK